MPVPSKMQDLFTLAASNSPAGSDLIGNTLDDYIRAGFAIVRSTNAIASASIASASTTDLGTADGEAVTVTGSATITSLGTSVSGLKREVTFAGACVLTNSAAIVLPLGSNITTSAGDVIQFRSLGSGNWAMVGGTKSPAYLPLAGGTVVGATSIAMSTPLGNTIGSSATPWEINQSSASSGSNLNRLRTSIVRTANGTTWNDTSIQISRVVDSTQQGFIQYGESSGGTGLAFGSGSTVYAVMTGAGAWSFTQRPTFNGNAAWDSGNFNPANYAQLSGATFTGGIIANAGIRAQGTTAFSGQGSYLGWNRSSGSGEMDLICHRGGGVGGFNLYNTDGTTYTTLSSLSSSGVWTATDFTATSDKRLKKQIRKKAVNERLVDLVRLCAWIWRKSGEAGSGVVAQEVQKVAPEYVHKGADGYLSVDKAGLALECVIGLAARVRQLEGDV